MHKITQLDSFDMDIDYRALCENLAGVIWKIP